MFNVSGLLCTLCPRVTRSFSESDVAGFDLNYTKFMIKLMKTQFSRCVGGS